MNCNKNIVHEITYYNEKICFDFLVKKIDIEKNINKKKQHNILVLDTSGSMYHVMNLLKSFTSEILDLISKEDDGPIHANECLSNSSQGDDGPIHANECLSIIVFGTDAEIILEGFTKDKSKDINKDDILNKIKDKGTTNGRDALKKINSLIKDDDYLYNIIFLTDGQFNGGCQDDLKTMIEENNKGKLIFNCVGFTEHHSEQTLQLLCSIGKISGNYTAIYEDIDIVTVADKYVTSLDDYMYNVSVKYGDDEQTLNRIEYDNWKTLIFDKGIIDKSVDFSIIIDDEVYTIKCTDIEIKLDEFHIKTHQMREKVIDAFKNNNYDELQIINNEICDLISLQNEQSSKRDVKILNQLHYDCSTIIQQIFNKKINSSSSQLLLRYIYEHQNQYSISTITNQRICYNNDDFTKMLNLKLLKKMEGVSDKELNLDKSTITYDKKYENDQKYVDDNIKCYITLDSWRDNNCYLGIGLYIKPRTTREIQRNLLPDIRMDYNYMSMMAYNTGVYMKFDTNPIQLFSDRDNPVNNKEIVTELEEKNIILDKTTKSEVMKMSVNNGFINAWIPIYINKYHWSDAKYYAKSAISLIAFQNNNISNSECVLKVYTNLFIRNVVHFVDSGILPDESIQMFCYLYRTLLELVKEYNLTETIDNELKKFIEKQHLRSRRYCSNLGDLIQLLFISDKYSYDDIKNYYVPELIRRNAIRLENIDSILECNKDNIIDEYSKQTEKLFKKSMLVVLLIKELKVGKSIEETTNYYDERWGLILKDEERIKKIKDGFDQILSCTSIEDKLNFLDFSLDKTETIGLILWSIRQKDSHCELVYSKPINPIFEHRKKSCYKTWQMIEDWKNGISILKKEKEIIDISDDASDDKNDYTTIFFYRTDDNVQIIEKNDSKLIKKEIRKFVENIIGKNNKMKITTVYKQDKLEYGFIKLDDRNLLEQFFNKLCYNGQIMSFDYKGNKLTYGLDVVSGKKSVKESKNYYYKNYSKKNKRMKTKGDVQNKEFHQNFSFAISKQMKIEQDKINYIENVPVKSFSLENIDDYLKTLLISMEIDGNILGYQVYKDNKIVKEKQIEDYMINNVVIVPLKNIHLQYIYKNKMPINVFLKEKDVIIYHKKNVGNPYCKTFDDSILCYY